MILRYIAETFGYTVKWDGERGEIQITSSSDCNSLRRLYTASLRITIKAQGCVLGLFCVIVIHRV